MNLIQEMAKQNLRKVYFCPDISKVNNEDGVWVIYVYMYMYVYT